MAASSSHATEENASNLQHIRVFVQVSALLEVLEIFAKLGEGIGWGPTAHTRTFLHSFCTATDFWCDLCALFRWDRIYGLCFGTVGGVVFHRRVRFQFHDCTAHCDLEVSQRWTILVRVAV